MLYHAMQFTFRRQPKESSMLTRRRLLAAFALLLPGAIASHARQVELRPAKPTTVTLIIEGMT